MEDVDRQLLEHVGGASARVVVLPTAAGLEEPASPRRWAESGVRHFEHLGARVEAAHILVRQDAFDPHWVSLLEHADFIYFSGGSPRHLVDTMQGTPAWATITARHAAGAALAGCSAGAMAFGPLTLQPRRLWSGGATPKEAWYPALGLLPSIITLPHFDRWRARMNDATLGQLAASLPAGTTLVGVDEDTALVSFDGGAIAKRRSVWHVLGRQGISLIEPDQVQARFRPGAAVELGRCAAPAR
jgi:cyanophycinase